MLSVVPCGQIDPDSAVREAAFQCQDMCMKTLTAHARFLKEQEEKRQAEALEQASLPIAPSQEPVRPHSPAAWHS